MKNLNKSTDDLIRDIKVVISKNRCSLTEEEKKLFGECIQRLEVSKKLEPDDIKQKVELMDVMMVIAKILSAASKLTDFFD